MLKLIKKIFDLLFLKNQQPICYYINSNNLLPQPLDEKEENRLLLLVKEGMIVDGLDLTVCPAAANGVYHL